MNFEKIQKALASTKQASTDDVTSFLEWERGDISTAYCIRRFRAHNMVNEDLDISQVDFELWLRSLGYRRRNAATYTEDQTGTHKGV